MSPSKRKVMLDFGRTLSLRVRVYVDAAALSGADFTISQA